MYRLSDFNDHTNKYKFMQLLKQNWDNIHNEIGVFRYKVDKIQKKLVGEKYSIQLNPDRGCKRRVPEQIDEICQTFNKNQFNFTKASPKEIIFCITNDRNESDVHTLLVNVSPISHYHTLLCPSMEKCLPQIATAESLLLTVEIFFLAQNRDLRIGFNSLCGFASVNHLHYHLFIEKNDLPVESLKCNHLFSHIYCIYDYPIPGFCFEVPDKNSAFSVVKDINKLVQYFLKKSIAHNILLTRGQSVVPGSQDKEVLRILVWPRKSTAGVKQLKAFNVAVCEISGSITVHDAESYSTLQKEDIENELSKWRISDFKTLCEGIKMLCT